MKAISLLTSAVVATGACGANPTSPSQSMVDVVTFIVGDTAAWPRTGDQFQNQVVIGSRVFFVKYGRQEMFEAWRWDDRFIYHDVDAALDGERAGESYRFTDGRWLPRYLAEGERWTLDMPNNRIEWFDSACRPMPSREGIDGLFPYRVSATISGDVLVLEYTPHGPYDNGGTPEIFHFRRGFGWYEWSRGQTVVRFDRIGGPNVLPSGCALTQH